MYKSSMLKAVTLASCLAAITFAGDSYGQDDLTLPLTLRDAVDIALARNLGLQVERLNVPLADTDTREAEAIFEPRWDSQLTYTKADNPNANIFTSSGGGGGGDGSRRYPDRCAGQRSHDLAR